MVKSKEELQAFPTPSTEFLLYLEKLHLHLLLLCQGSAADSVGFIKYCYWDEWMVETFNLMLSNIPQPREQ